jgi:hypothetical protein
MPSTVTVTARSGPNQLTTAGAFPNVSQITFDLDARVLRFAQGGNFPVKEFDLSTVTTTTFSISGANYTITVS